MTERERLQSIKSLPSLIKYLRDELDWPIDREDVDDLFFEYEPEELGIDPAHGAQIKEIKQLRPLESRQPWGIFYINFEPKRLPIVVLRKILSSLVIKKRASAAKAERPSWQVSDLLFISSYGESGERAITFAHFSDQDRENTARIPTLRVLGWDDQDTVLHLDHVHKTLRDKLSWPADGHDLDAWRATWAEAFILRPREVIATSKELALTLADLAKRIRQRAKLVLKVESVKGPLRKLHAAFKEALIHDLTEDDFADMYAQTIAYGLLAARISRPLGIIAENLVDVIPTTNPFLRDMLGEFLSVGGRKGKIDFDELGIQEVIDLLNNPKTNMEAVVRDFGDRNPQEDPVIHFYELFLKEYDAKKRMQRGVFYTPRPVVSYIVRSVDDLLRTEFGLKDGLADITTWSEMANCGAGFQPAQAGMPAPQIRIPEGISPDQPFVQILDPATGTGTFLVEVIGVIHKTVSTKWKQQGKSQKDIHALWNEYVPKHLLPRLHGYELLMAPYAIAHLKIGLKLYETGYRFGSDERARVYLTNALEPASDIQLRTTSLPALAHEAQAVNEVKRRQRFTVVIGNPPYAGHSSNKGTWVAGLLRDYYFVDGAPLKENNTKWLQDDYVKFIRLLQHLLGISGAGVAGFITNHGFVDNPTFRGMRKSLLDTFADLRVLDLHGSTKKKERAPDGTADENVFDIQQGVAITVGVTGLRQRCLRHGDLYGSREGKYARLTSSSPVNAAWREIPPAEPLYLFKPQNEDLRYEYQEYVAICDVMPVHSLGVVTARDRLCIHFTREDTWSTVLDFAAMKPEIARKDYALGPDAQDWQVALAQQDLRGTGVKQERLQRIYYRPFDWRWTFYTGHSRGFHCRPRGEVMRHMLAASNLGLSTTRSVEIGDFTHVLCSNSIIGHHCVSLKEVNYLFPLWIYPEEGEFQTDARPNLSGEVMRHFGKATQPEAIFHYAYAVLHSPGYRSRYAEFLKRDFPRLPVTGNLELLRELAHLGGELVALHLLESPKLDHFITSYTGRKSPEVVRVGWSDDTVWLDAAATKKGQPAKPGRIGFRGVPENVWNFHIGGYQVCEKWLKDRKGRTLSTEDIAHYQKIVVALDETIRIMAEIDEVIEKHSGWPGAFQGSQGT